MVERNRDRERQGGEKGGGEGQNRYKGKDNNKNWWSELETIASVAASGQSRSVFFMVSDETHKSLLGLLLHLALMMISQSGQA